MVGGEGMGSKKTEGVWVGARVALKERKTGKLIL